MPIQNDFTLDELVAIQDALEAINDGVTRDGYLEMHILRSKQAAGRAWDSAQCEVSAHGSVRRAANFVKRGIESFR